MEIQLIQHKDIDKTKWNSCVHYATNGNIFGYKWYLDAIAKEWDGLVEGDYESVLPLFITEREDLLEQPRLLREAGIYSINMLSKKRIQAFMDAIPEQYTNIQIQLNEGINIEKELGFDLHRIKNHQLLLFEPYDKIRAGYSLKMQAMLQKLDKAQFLPTQNVKPEKIAALFRVENTPNRDNEIAFHAYQRIMYNALHRGWGATFGVMDREKNILTAAFFIYSQGRVMQLVSGTTPKGKKLGAYEYMLDNFLQSHAGRPLLLDFNSTQIFPIEFGAQTNHFLRLEKQTSKKSLWQKLWA